MKYKRTILTSVLSLLVLVSCGESNDKNSTEESKNPSFSIPDINTDIDSNSTNSSSVDDGGNTENDDEDEHVDNQPIQVFNYNTLYSKEPTTFKSFATSASEDNMHIANFIDGLLDFDNYGRLTPSLAKAIPTQEIQKNGTAKWTFELKDNLKWSKWNEGTNELVNAAPVTAEDFVRGIKLALLKESKNNQSNYLITDYIKGATEFSIYASEVEMDGETLKHTSKEMDEKFDQIVGIKAINPKTIEYTLVKPFVSFPTLLSNQVYYPVSPLYNEISDAYGKIDYGNSRYNLWYNGAFALDKYIYNNNITYVKNPNYWDVTNVKLNNVKFIKSADYSSFSRNKFENNEIDNFVVNKYDTEGFKFYVSGNNTNDVYDPINECAQSVYNDGENAVFLLTYNFNRSNFTSTDLSSNQLNDLEKAIRNRNFRKAILHAFNKDEFNKRSQSEGSININTYNIGNLSFDDNGKDYIDYFINEYAVSNNLSYYNAKNIIGIGENGVFNSDLSRKYLNLAKEELNGKITFPIKLEFLEVNNNSYYSYYDQFANNLQQNLDPTKKIVEVSTKIATGPVMNTSLEDSNFSVTSYYGWSADYNDPQTFLNSYKYDGDSANCVGLTKDSEVGGILSEYNRLIEQAELTLDKEERYKLLAKAEYNLLYEEAIIIPILQRFTNTNVLVTKLQPKTELIDKTGNGHFKLKGKIVYDRALTKSQYANFIQEYEKNQIYYK